jgi:aarF domain-containing kinase
MSCLQCMWWTAPVEQPFSLSFFTRFVNPQHPGNLLLLNEPTESGARLALIDCGLMASIDPTDRDHMISAVIHLANKDYAALVDDFINLKILPIDTQRSVVTKLMDKALSPYLQGGGAKKYEAELRKLYGMDDTMQSQVGGFQAMTQDALTVLNDVPFSIPPYFAILGRAIVTLEGVALTGNPEYGIIMESYPFIARKLLRDDRPEIQSALQEVLYANRGESSQLKLTRLLALLNNAAGAVATREGAVFVDLDAVPEDGITLSQGLKFLLSDNADSLRKLLEKEVDNAVDLLSRQVFRRAMAEAAQALAPPRPPSLPFVGSLLPRLPAVDEVTLPILIPQYSSGRLSNPTVSFMTLKEFTQIVAPPLTADEEVYAIQLADGARQLLGDEVGDLLKGKGVLSPQFVNTIFTGLRSGALGRSDLFMSSPVDSSAVQGILGFVQDTVLSLWSLSGRERPNQAVYERDIVSAIETLSPQERVRFDEIVSEITRRVLVNALERLRKSKRGSVPFF